LGVALSVDLLSSWSPRDCPLLMAAIGEVLGMPAIVAVAVVFDNQDEHRKTLQENEKSQEKKITAHEMSMTSFGPFVRVVPTVPALAVILAMPAVVVPSLWALVPFSSSMSSLVSSPVCVLYALVAFLFF
jgi:hypothetical protein